MILLTDEEIKSAVCPLCTDRVCDICNFDYAGVRSACAAQHKADQEDFQKQKQEMFKEIEQHSDRQGLIMIFREPWNEFKHKWEIQ